MAAMNGKDAETINRRMASVSRHLIPPQNYGNNNIGLSNCSAKFDDTYHRVHGQVSSHIPEWKPAVDESGKQFVDIIYEKAVGEGIAKVLTNLIFFVFIFISFFNCIFSVFVDYD